ncbi:hypothetical protein ACIG0C_30185 [Kitasatospora aureofaciens]|uniref:Uncharacterized protein n=1 Tax=Kitasatospora aureofaciens TaxID=1894 RepID=A0A1E7NE77_KITAU|nr:hypothetical protein [Kitasatospora aureofaciens]ARF83225.1 hypothetical protein B6264_30255 [Kitasatospora aureofaciens]OEV38997.1 hypothetical protein HS99_0017985 [Kitasatospora aureofaciens]GGU99391.1 hypothetical protein GCM10010502_62310 [Kitasatospora aureofaciens]
MKQRSRISTDARRAYYCADSTRRWIARCIGPRRVGGIYRGPYAGDAPYEVLAIDPGPREGWPTWQITVRTVGEDRIRRHCTAWDHERDVVIKQPEDENFAQAWAAWQLTHDPDPWTPREADSPDWQHVLDEIAHPVSTAAFQKLAHTARIS